MPRLAGAVLAVLAMAAPASAQWKTPTPTRVPTPTPIPPPPTPTPWAYPTPIPSPTSPPAPPTPAPLPSPVPTPGSLPTPPQPPTPTPSGLSPWVSLGTGFSSTQLTVRNAPPGAKARLMWVAPGGRIDWSVLPITGPSPWVTRVVGAWPSGTTVRIELLDAGGAVVTTISGGAVP